MATPTDESTRGRRDRPALNTTTFAHTSIGQTEVFRTGTARSIHGRASVLSAPLSPHRTANRFRRPKCRRKTRSAVPCPRLAHRGIQYERAVVTEDGEVATHGECHDPLPVARRTAEGGTAI